MLGLGEKKIGFVDLSKLRFGIFKKHYRNPNDGSTEIVEYLPPRKLSNRKIVGILPGSLQEVPVYDDDSEYSTMMVLVAGERGESPFLEKNLSEKGMIVDMIRQLKKMQDYNRISVATAHSITRNAARGGKSVLKERVDDVELIDKATGKREFPYRYKKHSSSNI